VARRVQRVEPKRSLASETNRRSLDPYIAAEEADYGHARVELAQKGDPGAADQGSPVESEDD
jgi:hypothetical protein